MYLHKKTRYKSVTLFIIVKKMKESNRKPLVGQLHYRIFVNKKE